MNYTTVQGDMWDIISRKVYGNEFYADKLMKANPSYSSTVIFSSGTTLEIPDVQSVKQFADLPPWKRG
ncbi:tail protein X [Bacillus sp. JJ1773]|uniref:tail protein X n=1 Tax=Bacillus sp. JJ1773 TaxID=3122965 RepID=UPI002FFF341F